MSPMSPWGDIFIDQQHTVPILLDGGAVAGLALRPVAPALSAREANVCVRCAIGDRRGAWFPAGPRPNVRGRVLCQGPPRWRRPKLGRAPPRLCGLRSSLQREATMRTSRGHVGAVAIQAVVLGLVAHLIGLGTATAGPKPAGQTFTVTNLSDGGPGSLRAAIDAANASPGAATIRFAPGLKGTILLGSVLSITDDVTIG